MLLSDMENLVRLDLFDPAGPNQRWANGDIDRAIDKAIDRYTHYYPNIAYADMASQPYQGTYPYPTSWNASYPVLWIERIIYPLQVYGSTFAAPVSGATANRIAGSGLAIGSYQYTVSFLSQGGETPPSSTFSVTTTSGQQQVMLANIPLAPALSGMPGVTNTVIGRNIYRTLVGGSTLLLLATLPDNTTTSFTDSVADSTLAGMPSPPTLNSSGVMYYPPIERNFSEYSNLFDSTASLAAGGNLGMMGAVGPAAGLSGTQEPTFTLMLSNMALPRDNTLIMRVFYATKHQLDNNGSTIPEVHRDVIVLGACAYAMEAYQVGTNDNFEWQDGAIHDRIDDTKIPTAWRMAAQNKMLQFVQRLEEIKHARDFVSSSRVQLGDVPRYWFRL